MNTPSPFSFLQTLATRLQPPAWVVDEVQQRLVLFINHVLMQEPEAQARLKRKKGNVVHAQWGLFALHVRITPAGLLNLALPADKADLSIAVASSAPLDVVQSIMAGKPPPVKIEGDVQLAAELGWLAENLRWDFEEDLSRIMGDIPAHALADAARSAAAALKQFLTAAKGKAAATGTNTTSTVPAAPVDVAQGQS